MAYRLSNDFEARVRARTILARPNLIGTEAWTLSEPELDRVAETFMNSLAGNCAALRLHSRRLGSRATRQHPARQSSRLRARKR